MKTIKTLIKKAGRVEEAVVVLIFVVMILASFTQVLNRNIFRLPIGWPEELARYCQVYLALLAMELGLRDGSQMALTAVVDKLSGKTKQIMAILAKGVVVLFSILMFTQSVVIIQGLITSGQKSPALKLPMYLPYMALPLSFGIASVVECGILLQMLFQLTGHKKGQEV